MATERNTSNNMPFPGLFRRLFTIAAALTMLLLWVNCSNLMSLKLPAASELDPEKDWLTLGRNHQHQHFANSNIQPPLDIVWKKKVKSVVTDHPLAAGDFIFAPTRSGILYIVDYQEGQGVGNGKIGPAMSNVPTIDKNRLYTGFTIGEKTLLSFDLSDSDKIIDKRYPNIITTPLVWENKVFFGTDAKTFFCVNATSGEQIWEFSSEARIQSSPALHEQRIYFGDDSGTLYALEAASGIEIWRKTLNGSIFSHPVLDDSRVFVGTVTGEMHAFSQEDGSEEWKSANPGAIFSSPAIYQNMIYFGHNGHEVVALNKATGKPAWTFQTEGIVNTVPLPSPDFLYVTSWDRHLYVLNRYSGQLVFKYKLKKPSKSSPIIYRDYLLVHTANNELIAFANEQFIASRKGDE